MKLDDTMLMYGIYNAEMLEKLINTVYEIHNTTSSHEKLFAGEHNHSIFRILYTHSLGVQHYSTNSLLYLRIIQDKYIAMYRELITQLYSYCYVRQYALYGMSRGKFTTYIYMCSLCTAIHNYSSSGSLLFSTLRQNN